MSRTLVIYPRCFHNGPLFPYEWRWREPGCDTHCIKAIHQAVDAFVKGDPTPLGALYARHDDATLANPFGPPVRGWAQIEPTMPAALPRMGELLAGC